MQILRKNVPLTNGVYQPSFPAGSQVLSADMKGDKLSVWVMGDMAKASEPYEKKNILVITSGRDIPAEFTRFLKTVVIGELVWHVLTDDGGVAVPDVENITLSPVVKSAPAKVTKPAPKQAIAKGKCSNGCKSKTHAKGLCQKCYDKLRRQK